MPLHFIVHSFTDAVFGGNPAGVCPLDEWIDDQLMQKIAAENRVSETAFFVPEGGGYRLRWFTPVAEVDLCGHATLAAAYVLFHHLGYEEDLVVFNSASGELPVQRLGRAMVMSFPARPAEKVDAPEALVAGLRCRTDEAYRARDYMVVLDNEDEVLAVDPDFDELRKLDCTGIIVTAPGSDVDFVSRFFAPAVGVDEDPVTGSAHCTLAPYWGDRLGKDDLSARQISARGGELACKLVKDRVHIAGRAALYVKGMLEVE